MREICLLGTVQVESSDQNLPRFRSQRTMALLGYLVVERRPLTRNHLAALFWPDELPENGKRNLRRELYNLTQILPDCWEADRLKVNFVPSKETVIDLDEIRKFEQKEKWLAAAEMLRGDFLEGLVLDDNYEFETWLLGERERWRQRAAHILTKAVDELEKQGSYIRAQRYAQQILQMMPWREEAHRHVMRLLALSDQRNSALKQFDICKQVLWEELGVEPSAETLTLYTRIRRTSHFSRDNIPAISTPLIGREKELQSLSDLIANPNVRLVTITGLGGIGKTRLALEIAWQQTKGQFSDGVTFVKMADLDSADQIVPAIAQALHLPLSDTVNNPAHEQLLNYLKFRKALLILDNCEHLIDGMAIVAQIISAAPQVQILATSRNRLRLLAEVLFPLQGLPYDEAHTSHPAAQLVSSTAQRINPLFELSDRNASSVNKICNLVDGMPLALELAASRLDTTAIDIVVAEVENSLGYLAADLHDIPARHRSLRALLESIWLHIEPQFQQVFAALSTFRGSFSAKAASEVAGAAANMIEYLVQHSLLKYDAEQDRYQLHEMLRQFAAEKLAGMPEFEQIVTRLHFITYNDLAQRGDEAMRGGDQSEWMVILEMETSNFRQAIDWAVYNDIEQAASLVVSLHNYWLMSGQVLEAMQQYERIIPHQEELSPQRRSWLLAVSAVMLFELGHTSDSIALGTKALSLFLEHGDDGGAAFIYLLWSYIARRVSKDINISIQLAEAGLKHALTPGLDSYHATLLLDSLSDSLTRSGRFEEAEARIKQGYQLCIQRDDLMTANFISAQWVMLASLQGQIPEARRIAEEYLSMSRQLNMLREEILALDNLAIICYSEGNFERAEKFATDGIALAQEANFTYYLAALKIIMGEILMAKGAFSEALPFIREALFLFQDMDHQIGIPTCMESLAEWIWRRDKKESTPVRWMACAIAHLTANGQIQSPSEIARRAKIRAELETSLGEEEVARAWTEGEQMSIEEALDEIMPKIMANSP